MVSRKRQYYHTLTEIICFYCGWHTEESLKAWDRPFNGAVQRGKLLLLLQTFPILHKILFALNRQSNFKQLKFIASHLKLKHMILCGHKIVFIYFK